MAVEPIREPTPSFLRPVGGGFGGRVRSFFGRFTGYTAEPSSRLHLLGWGVACLGAVTAAAGMAVNRPDMALAGSAIWFAAATIHAGAVLRRYFPRFGA